MKILRVAPCEKLPKTYTLQLTYDADTHKLSGTVGTFLYGEGDLILNIACDLPKWVGKLVEFRIMMTEKGFEVVHFDSMKNYNIANGLPGSPEGRRDMRTRIFRIFVNENIDDSIIQIFSGHEAIEGFEDIVEDGELELRMHNLIRCDSNVARVLELARLKSAMLGEVDQRDSVSYLEAQVDILTRVILAVLPDNKDVLVELLRKADARSVLNIKDRAALEKEFVAKKDWVRKVQKDYYEAKKALEAPAS